MRPRSAHPRSRGENSATGGSRRQAAGSSPLTRGKPGGESRQGCGERLIPAHAGKTWAYPSATFPPRAHPRSRGENHARKVAKPGDKGSSPLTRGKLIPVQRGFLVERLIPAHAGKTKSVIMTGVARAAHPRSRGENRFRRSRASGPAGSSPLTRGKLTVKTHPTGPQRLIPAHAGKTQSRSDAESRVKAHPRSRGENFSRSSIHRIEAGSSPLTRGKRPHSAEGERTGRLIPAHAGKTRWQGPCPHLCPAHPRSRGENPNSLRTESFRPGSSPLTRGKHLHLHRGNVLIRLIPAHAGKTRPRRAVPWGRAAHPRSRGENRWADEDTEDRFGSSPLTRGKLQSVIYPELLLGLIPAHAGKTSGRG